MENIEHPYPVLVVSYEKPVQSALQMTLEDDGYTTLGANDGKKAFEIVQEARDPLIVVFDLMLPQLNLLEALATHSYLLAQHRFILLTAASRSALLTDEMKRAIPVLSKPFDFDNFAVLIQQAEMSLHDQQAHDALPPVNPHLEERLVLIHDLRAKNVQAGKSPYSGIHLLTQGELEAIVAAEQQHTLIDLQEIDLSGVSFEETNFMEMNLTGANFTNAVCTKCVFRGAKMNFAIFNGATLQNSYFLGTMLQGASFLGAHITGVDFTGADLSEARLANLSLIAIILRKAILEKAFLQGADCSAAILEESNLQGTQLSGADLRGANLRYARFNSDSDLSDVVINNKTLLEDVRWNDVALTRVHWQAALRLGDEENIRAASNRNGRIKAYRDAARAYRGLSIALSAQGMKIPASRYRLREQQLERSALAMEGQFAAWVGLGILDLTSGYGERTGRIFLTYLLVVCGFAVAYYYYSSASGLPFSPLSAFIFSLTSFHGRGFFPGGIALDSPLTVCAGAEAVIGLFIEITLISTFSRRFFGA